MFALLPRALVDGCRNLLVLCEVPSPGPVAFLVSPFFLLIEVAGLTFAGHLHPQHPLLPLLLDGRVAHAVLLVYPGQAVVFSGLAGPAWPQQRKYF